MRPAQTMTGLSAVPERGAGTDAERRATGWLAEQLESRGQSVTLAPFWSRPNWALAHAWHAALGIAGSLTAISAPRVGGALLLLAIASVILDELSGRSLGRRLTPERASQNLLARPGGGGAGDPERVRLILTANLDAGRTGVAFRPGLRGAAAWLRRASGGRSPGWLAWLVLALLWLVVIAILREEGHRGSAVAVAQLIATAALIIALALLIDIGTAAFSPGAGDNASGVAAAVSVAAALAVAPPRWVEPELVLTGAGDVSGLGLRHYLRAHRHERRAANTVVLGFAPCPAGAPRWWISDGALVPARYFAPLQRLARELAGASGATGVRGRGSTPALPARLARLPALSLGALESPGQPVPHSHQPSDTPDHVDAAAVDRVVELALMLVDAIDADVGRRRSQPPAPRLATPA